MAESESLLIEVKEESDKAGLKLSIKKTKIMASGPTTSWQIEGEKSDSNSRFCFLVFQNHCGQWLQPWNEKTLARQHIKKQRHYFANKVRLVKAMVFPVVMYGCES